MAFRKSAVDEVRREVGTILNDNRGELTERMKNATIVPILREKTVITRPEKQACELNDTEDTKNDKLIEILSRKRIAQFRILLEVLRNDIVDLPDMANKLEKQFDGKVQKMAKECIEKISAEKENEEAIEKFLEILRLEDALLPDSVNKLETQFHEKIERTLEDMQNDKVKALNFLEVLRRSGDEKSVDFANERITKLDEELSERLAGLKSVEESGKGNKIKQSPKP